MVGDTVFATDEWLAPPRPLFRSSRGILDAFVESRPRLRAHEARLARGVRPAEPARRSTSAPWPAGPVRGRLRAARRLARRRADRHTRRGRNGRRRAHLDAAESSRSGRRLSRRSDGMGRADDGSRSRPTPRPRQSSSATVRSARSPRTSWVKYARRCDVTSSATRYSSAPSRGAVTSRWQPRRARPTSTRHSCARRWKTGGLSRTAPRSSPRTGTSCASRSTTGPSSRPQRTRSLATSAAATPCLWRPLPCPRRSASCARLPAGGTALLAYDETEGRLRAVREFATPRLVESPSNGTWLVHGSCGEAAAPSTSTYCVGVPAAGGAGRPEYTWRDARMADEPGAVVTVTTGGALVQISSGGSFDDAHLTSTGPGGVAARTPLHLVDPSPAARRMIEHAVWLNGVEERRPGVLSGWVAAEGTVVGIEVEADGAVRVGAQGARPGARLSWPGRYGLGWSRAHNSYETTDGGMTWTPFSAPLPAGTPPTCARADLPGASPTAGSVSAGANARPRLARRSVSSPPLRWEAPRPFLLTCRATVPFRRLPARARPLPVDLLGGGDRNPRRQQSRCRRRPSNSASFETPAIGRTDRLFHADIFGAGHSGAVGRIFAWGPASADWSGQGRWVVRWRSPFGGKTASASSLVAAAPFQDADDARDALGVGRSGPVSFTAVVSDDAAHLLLRVVHPGRTTEVATLDAGGTFAKRTPRRWGSLGRLR